MRHTGTLVLAAMLVASACGVGDTAEISVKTMPPSVIKTVPQAGDTAVDPSVKEVSVTFSKEMMTEEMWSWCSSSAETFPEIDKTKIRYLKDKRTCVLPVTLAPGKTYVIWINSSKFTSFKDTGMHSAVPYLLVFQTAGKAPSSSGGVPDGGSASAGAEKAAVASAESWLSLVDGGKYEESWNEAAQYFKNAVSKDQWGQAIRAARKPLGKTLSRKLMSKSYETSLPGAPDGEYVVIQFKASFENKKSAIETITPMMDKDGKWRVSGYFIK